MTVNRLILGTVDAFRVGDTINFSLEDTGEHIEAMAMKQEPDGMIFMSVDGLQDGRHMNVGGNVKCFEETSLRRYLGDVLLQRFPDYIRKLMVSFPGGDMIRIATEKEVYGENFCSKAEPDEVEQWEPMKTRRNRIAGQGHNGHFVKQWLANHADTLFPSFVAIGPQGNRTTISPKDYLYYRPVFKLRATIPGKEVSP